MKTNRLLSFLFVASITVMGGQDRVQALSLLGDSPVSIEVIVSLESGGNLIDTIGALNGVLLDEIPGTELYLMAIPSLPLFLPPGVSYIETNGSAAMPNLLPTTVLTASSLTPAHWYEEQAALRVVKSNEAQAYSNGLDVVVAVIDARFDPSHPALINHMNSGKDFVSKDGTDETLDQSSASYMFEETLDQSSASYMFEETLDQSSASYMFEETLDQSSASYMFEETLDQSSASYMFEETLDQSSASYMFEGVQPLLDQSSASYMFESGAGYTHGTFVAGLIAVTAPGAKIMPLRAFDDSGQADTFTLTKAIRYAVQQGADVINMSWGTADNSRTLRKAIKFAHKRDVVMVSSAGNSNSEGQYFPAAYPHVIAVAATENTDKKSNFSSYGKHVHSSAPGTDIISALPDGYYGIKSGTSFSAPIVAGQAANLISLRLENVSAIIGRTSVYIDDKNRDYEGKLGEGRIDFLNSVSRY